MRGRKSSEALRVTDSANLDQTERKLSFTKTMLCIMSKPLSNFIPKPAIAPKSQTHQANLKLSPCVFLTGATHLILAFLAYGF